MSRQFPGGFSIFPRRMKNNFWKFPALRCFLAIAWLGFSSKVFAGDARQTLNFDASWLFLKGDPQGVEQPNFDDSLWRQLNIPHDWSLEGPFNETNKGTRTP